MLTNYKIGMLTIQIDSDFLITESEIADQFRSSEPGWLRCSCQTVESVRDDYVNRIYSEDKLNVYRVEQGVELVRYSQLPRIHPYLSATEHHGGRSILLRYGMADMNWSAQIGYFWRAISLRHCLMKAGNLILHSSYICVDGKAILFAGGAETGKTTQAELWAKFRGATIINGGRAVIGVENGVPMAYGVPLSGDSHICKNQSMPIRAIVVLGQGPENLITPLSGSRAMAAVGRHASCDNWRGGEYATALSILDEILSGTVVLGMNGTPDERSVRALERMLTVMA